MLWRLDTISRLPVGMALRSCAAVLVLAPAACSVRSGDPGAASLAEAVIESPAPVPMALVASPSYSQAMASLRGESEVARRGIAGFRRELPAPLARPPLPDEAVQSLSRAAESLGRGSPEQALAAIAEARRRAPFAPEPLELETLAHLSRANAADLREAIETLRDLDPINPIVLVFEGLEAVQRGDPEVALSTLSWFIGPDALPRRGVAVPLPTAVGEIEEQAAVAAIRLGAMQAALDALDAALAVRESDPAASRRLELLRADALLGLGRGTEAAEALEHVVADGAPGDPIGLLADLRRDHQRVAAGLGDEVFDEAWRVFLGAPSDEAALVRLLRAARHARSDARAAATRELAAGSFAISPLRAQLVRLSLAGRGAMREGMVDLERMLVADPTDRPAVRAAFRLLADPRRAARLACELVLVAPNELDAVASALLASGAEIDTLLAVIEAEKRGAEGDALRSRMHARFGFPEEALAIADGARMRDRASPAALAASALAAAELGDETLLREVDAESIAAGGGIARTLAAAWLAVGDSVLARERAEQALVRDPEDERAALIAALASLDDPARADAACATIRSIVARGGRCAGDAWTRLADVEASERRRGVRSPERLAPIEAAPRLMSTARSLDEARLPLSIEAIALAEELDPSLGAITVMPSSPASVSVGAESLRAWSRRIVDDAPALPGRRRFAAVLAGRVAGDVPASPLAARFDALATASAETRARADLLRATLRPRTPAAIASLARQSIAVGQHAEAAAFLDAVCRGEAPIPPRAARDLLLAQGELVLAAPGAAAARTSASADCILRCVRSLGRAGPEDMLAAMRAVLGGPADSSAVDAIAEALAAAAEPMTPEAFPTYGELFRSIITLDDDPFPASRLALALARRANLDPVVRGRFATASIAFGAAAGDGADGAIALIDGLVGQGVRPFTDASDADAPLAPAEIFVRASSVFGMVGDAAGSERMLLAALARDPEHASALNNLAYARMRAGVIDDATISMAERAAKARPDDPGVLDTLGLLRYHQGALRDNASGPGAISLYRQALRLKPDEPSIETLDHLGDALWRDGDQQGAIRCWQQVPQIATLRFPPIPMARNLIEYQRRQFGAEIVEPEEYLRRQYGTVVERAGRKLEEVARGAAPSIEDCKALR